MNYNAGLRAEVRLMGYIGFAAFALLLVWAVYLAKLKMGFTDPAFHSFEILQREGLAIQVNRFGAAVTEFFPLMAYKFGLSLKSILVIYSASFMLLHLLVYTWLWRRHGVAAAWLLLLSYLLFSTDLFYWTISEHQQAMIYVCIWAAWLYDSRDKALNISSLFINTFAFVWIVFLYPSSFLTIFFVLGFAFLHQNNENKNENTPANTSFFKSARWAWFLSLAALLVAVMLVKAKLFANEYDAQKYGNMWVGLQKIAANKELLPSMKAFLRHCTTDYYWFVLVVLANISAYILRRQWLLAVWQIGSILAVILLVQLTIHEDGGKFYIDNMYLPLGFIAALPLFYDTIGQLYNLKNTNLGRQNALLYYAHAALMLFVFVRLYQVWQRQDIYQQRQAWVNTSIEKLKNNPNYTDKTCFITTESEVPMNILLGCSWSVGYETLLLSSYDNPENAISLLVVPSLDGFSPLLESQENRWFGTPWGNLDTWARPAFRTHFKLKNLQYQPVSPVDLAE
jgi:hypothetical protein